MAEIQKEAPILVNVPSGQSYTAKRLKSLSVAPEAGATATITALDDDGNPTSNVMTLTGIAGNWTASGGFVFCDFLIEASGGAVAVSGTTS